MSNYRLIISVKTGLSDTVITVMTPFKKKKKTMTHSALKLHLIELHTGILHSQAVFPRFHIFVLSVFGSVLFVFCLLICVCGSAKMCWLNTRLIDLLTDVYLAFFYKNKWNREPVERSSAAFKLGRCRRRPKRMMSVCKQTKRQNEIR